VGESDATTCDEPFFGDAGPWLYWIFFCPLHARIRPPWTHLISAGNPALLDRRTWKAFAQNGQNRLISQGLLQGIIADFEFSIPVNERQMRAPAA
jgi:hypothetical protein